MSGARSDKPWLWVLPAFGLITEGLLKGWRYAFIQFIRIDNTIAMDLRVTPPNWPFPKEVRLRLDKHRIHLQAVSGERAPRLDANALIERCLADGIAKSPTEDM